MAPKPENLPAVHLELVVVDRQNHGGSVCVIRHTGRDGDSMTLMRQLWPSGRPTPDDVRLLESELLASFVRLVLDRRGIQGVLTT